MVRVKRQVRPRKRIVCAAGGAVFLALSLVGCTGPSPQSSDSATPTASSTPAPSAGETSVPVPPVVLAPTLSAAENLTYFDLAASGAVAANPGIDGRSFVDALVTAGFDKAQMEVTFDRTAADLAADSIQVSVRFNGECLIAQNGPATGGYHGMVAPLLGTGTCLVGATRQIDW